MSSNAASRKPEPQAAPDSIVEVRDVHYSISGRAIFSGLNLTIPRGRITAIMGPSGTGKTTLLRLMTGQIRPDSGQVLFDGTDVCSLSTRELYALRMRMGMLFQNGALLTDEDVFENVAFPLREHTDLPEALIRNIVLTKLQAVGLRGAARLMPAELSGGMARRVALARAMATDPEMLIYDEPFTGLDPISMGMIVRLVRQMNYALGITSIVVSHDVEELAILADASYIISGGKVAASGSFVELKDHDSEIVHQFVNGLADGPVPFHYPAPDYYEAAAGRLGTRMHFLRELLDNVQDFVATVGAVTLFFGRVLVQLPRAFLRPSLVIEQVHNAGALSLVIIMTCGLFVGMVLGLTGYDLLQRFGSEEALGTAAALAVVKELGPVVTALLFAGRAGTALASEIGLMRATDQLTAMEMMAVDPMRRVIAPRFRGRHHRDAAADDDLHRDRHLRRAARRRAAVQGRRGVVLVADALERRPGRHHGRRHQGLRVRRRLQPDRRVRGLQRRADRRRCRARDDTHRGHLGGADTDSGLHPDRDHALRIDLCDRHAL